ncbi:MAG: hypothetical protein K2Y37_19870 [Pirellulales bacterium]|nr:hypothetical protein [Pirellulales bacterium]
MQRSARSMERRRGSNGSRRRRVVRPPKHFFTLERLERRDLLTILMWIGGDGNFGDANNWQEVGGTLQQVPGLADTALFSEGHYQVTVADGQKIAQLRVEAGAGVTLAGSGLFTAGLAKLDAASLIVSGDATQFEVTTDVVLSGGAALAAADGAIIMVGQQLDLGTDDEASVTAESGRILVGVTAADNLAALKAPAILAAQIAGLAYIAARDVHVAWRSGAVPINQQSGGFATTGIEAGYLPGAHIDALVLGQRLSEALPTGFAPQSVLGDATLSYDAGTGKLRLAVPVNFSGNFYPFFPDLTTRISFNATGQLVAYADVGVPGQQLDFTTLDNQFDFVVDPEETFLNFSITGTAPLFGNFTMQAQEPGSLTARFGGKLVTEFTARTATEPATIRFLETSVVDALNHDALYLPGPVVETAGVQILPDGRVTGRGTIVGDVTNDGLLQLAASTGSLDPTLLVLGNFTQSSLGTLQLDITPGYHALAVGLAVSGTATLDHTLRLNLQGDFSGRTEPLYAVTSTNAIAGALSEVVGNRAGATYFDVDDVSDPFAVIVQPRQAGLVVETSANFYTDELGKTATFGVRLSAPPTAPVTVQIGTSDSSEGTATNLTGGNSLVFTDESWDGLQTVIVTGVDDEEFDGDISYFVNLHVVSADPAYAGLADVRPPLVNRDDELTQDKFAAIHLKVTDQLGNVLPDVEVGQSFYLEIWVDDLRGEIVGSVLAAYADVVYGATLASVSGAAVFSNDFPLERSLSTASAGLLDELGAATEAESEDNERLLVRVPFVAVSDGLLGFTANAAGGVGHGVHLSQLQESLLPRFVEFGSTSVNVVPASSDNVVSLHDAEGHEGNDGNTPLSFQVELSQLPTAPITVFYRVFAADGDSATADVDFVAETGSITISPADETRFKNIVAHVKGDPFFEGNETFHVEITDVEGPATVDRALATGTILNDDARPVVNIDDSVLGNEGDSGETPYAFQVNLSRAIDVPVTVFYRVIAGLGDRAASPNEDFVAEEGSITFAAAAGPQSQNIGARVLGDTAAELSETFRVELTGVTGPAQLGQSIGTGTILNDDPPLLLMDSVEAIEGDAGEVTFVYRVRLSQPSDDLLTVIYQVGENPLLGVPAGSATPGVDYTAGAGFLTFNPGDLEHTFEVTAFGDNVEEDNETFYVGLYDLRHDTPGPVRRGTIIDDDDLDDNVPAEAPEVDLARGRVEVDGLISAGPGGNGGSGELVDLLITEEGTEGLPGDWDFRRFTLDRDATIRIEVIAERLPQFGGPPSSLDAVLALLKLDGVSPMLVATNDDSIGRDPVIELELVPGTYAVGVGGAQGTRGPYQLVIELDAPPVVDHMAPADTVAGSPTILTLFLNDADVDEETVVKQAFELLAEDPVTHALMALDDVLGDPQYLPALHRILVPVANHLADGRYRLRVDDTILSQRGGKLRSDAPAPAGFAFEATFAIDTLPPVLLGGTLGVAGASSTEAGLFYRIVGQLDDAVPATAGELARVELDVDGDGEFDDGFKTVPLEADGATPFSVPSIAALPFAGGQRQVAVRLVDARGNQSVPATLVIDTDLPIVTDVRAATAGPKVLVSFSRDDLQNIDQTANYTISSGNIIGVAVSADHRTVELTLDSLPDGIYTLTVHTGTNAIFAPGQGAAIELLDGNYDSTPGDDFTGSFAVDRAAPTIVSVKLHDAPGSANYTAAVQPELLVAIKDAFPGAASDAPVTLAIDLDDDGRFDDGVGVFTLNQSNQAQTVSLDINRPLPAGAYSANLRLADAAGNAVEKAFAFVVDRLGPQVESATVNVVKDGAGDPTGMVVFEIEFDEDLDPAAATGLLTYRLLRAGGDGNLYDVDPATDQADAIVSRIYRTSAQTGGRAKVVVTANLAGQPDDDYQLIVDGARLIDRAGNPLVGGDYRVPSFQWASQASSRVESAEFASSTVNTAAGIPVIDLVVLRFSGPDLVASQVQTLANYALERLDAPAGPIGLTGAFYDPLTNSAMLRLAAPVAPGSYQLTVRTNLGVGINNLAGFPLSGGEGEVAGEIVLPVTFGELTTFQNLLNERFVSLEEFVDQVTLDALNSRKAVANRDFARRLLQELLLAGNLAGTSAEVAAAINALLAALVEGQFAGIEADNLANQGEFVVLWARDARFLLGEPSNGSGTGAAKRLGQSVNGLLVQEIPGATLLQIDTVDGPLMLAILPVDPRSDLLGNNLVLRDDNQPAVPNFLLDLELEGFVDRNQAGYLLVSKGQIARSDTFADVPRGTDLRPFQTQQFNLAPAVTGIDPNIELINQHVQRIVEGIFGPLGALTRSLLWGWIDPVDYTLLIGQGALGSQGGQPIDTAAGGSISTNGATGLLVWSGAPSGLYGLDFSGTGTAYRGALNFNDGTNSLFASVQGQLGLGTGLRAQIDFRLGTPTAPGGIDPSGALAAAAFALRIGADSSQSLVGSGLSPAIRALLSTNGGFGASGLLGSILQLAGHVGRRGKEPRELTELFRELLDLRGQLARESQFVWLLPEVDRLMLEAGNIADDDLVGRRRIEYAIEAIKRQFRGNLTTVAKPVVEGAADERSGLRRAGNAKRNSSDEARRRTPTPRTNIAIQRPARTAVAVSPTNDSASSVAAHDVAILGVGAPTAVEGSSDASR